MANYPRGEDLTELDYDYRAQWQKALDVANQRIAELEAELEESLKLTKFWRKEVEHYEAAIRKHRGERHISGRFTRDDRELWEVLGDE